MEASSEAGRLVQQLHRGSEKLSWTAPQAPCFEHFSRMQRITDIQAEINQKNLELELLKMERDSADVAHPFYLARKCDALQSMNGHLEAVLKEKRSLQQRLMKPLCQENLPIEAAYHRFVVELLDLAVAFIAELESHLDIIRSIPHLESALKNMHPSEADNVGNQS
ncbi:HAUS augmin-like complex subunit 2 isoform X2 [Tachyglossus aculeatus]|uniref:HAUS augmin-like complex subunit 2 isoform X2 n=1 Tax=Tachyglossus aculeatus TaxID=9261 RepID=UPI0018F7A3F6|nr:HAUS augmin-like complex subunit 2 isoform X2 [Tachyglossus aculeatus]